MTGGPTPVDKFPFGVPVNRPVPKAELTPVPGRPNWYKDKAGVERYVEHLGEPKLQPFSRIAHT